MTLFYLGLAWLLGIAGASLLTPPISVLAAMAIPCVGTLLMWPRDRIPRLAALCSLALLAGLTRATLIGPPRDPNHVMAFKDTGTPVTITGIVDSEPELRDTFQQLRIRAKSITIDAETSFQPREARGLLLARVARYPAHHYGERLSLTGQLVTPPVFENFDYRDYLARQDIYVVMNYPRVRVLSTDEGSPFWQTLYALRQHLSSIIEHLISEPYASLLKAILLGDRNGIPAPLYAQFRSTGTSHVIVISGSNIAVLCGFLLAATTRLAGRRIALYVSLLGIAAYVMLAGADAPVIRAAIMGGLYVIALRFGRRAEVRTSLIMAAVLMTMVNPAWFRDPGFQLSFSATAGLIWLAPLLENILTAWLSRVRGIAGLISGLLGDGLTVTFAAQLATLPVVVYHFGRISLVSLFTNILIVPVQPLIMLSGALALLFGTIWLPVGQVIGWFVWLPLAWMVMCVESTAHISSRLEIGVRDALDVAGIALGAMLIVAILYLVLHNRSQSTLTNVSGTLKRLRTSTQMSLTTAVMLVLPALAANINLPDGRLHIAFLNVGQGDAIFITTPHGCQILVDGGPAPSVVLAALGQHMPFWDRTLDMVVNTHPESDHLAGLLGVLDRYQVKQVVIPPVETKSTLYATWQTALRQANVSTTLAKSGMRINTSDSVVIETLHPSTDGHYKRLNDHSLVLRITLGRISFLLTGDITSEVEQELLRRYPGLSAAVFKVPHHGSSTSSDAAFLRAVQPRIAVLSVAAENSLNLPAAEVLQRYQEIGIPVVRTDQAGTIELITDGERLWIRTQYSTPEL